MFEDADAWCGIYLYSLHYAVHIGGQLLVPSLIVFVTTPLGPDVAAIFVAKCVLYYARFYFGVSLSPLPILGWDVVQGFPTAFMHYNLAPTVLKSMALESY